MRQRMAQAAKSPPAATGHSLPSVRAEEHCRHDTGVGPPAGLGLKLAVIWRLTCLLRFMNARFQACPGNVRAWNVMEFGKSQTAVENREKWRKLVAKSSVVPQRPSRLSDWWRWWWWRTFLGRSRAHVRSMKRQIRTGPGEGLKNPETFFFFFEGSGIFSLSNL